MYNMIAFKRNNHGVISITAVIISYVFGAVLQESHHKVESGSVQYLLARVQFIFAEECSCLQLSSFLSQQSLGISHTGDTSLQITPTMLATITVIETNKQDTTMVLGVIDSNCTADMRCWLQGGIDGLKV